MSSRDYATNYLVLRCPWYNVRGSDEGYAGEGTEEVPDHMKGQDGSPFQARTYGGI